MVRSMLLLTLFSVGLFAQPKKILLMSNSPEVLKDWMSVKHPNVRLVPVTRDTIMKEIVDADACVCPITPEQVRAGKKLKWVQSWSAGVENILFRSGGTDLRDSDIVLTNNKISEGIELADHAFALLLYNTRQLYRWRDQKDKEVWDSRGQNVIALPGMTAVVIGVGGAGTQIAFRAWAFGMKVIGVDPEDKPIMPIIDRMVRPDQLNEVLPEADVVFVSAPWTAESHKMIGPSQFEKMKKGAYFIAVSRGGLYDMDALVKALDSKHLSGAGVDVTDPEPLPKSHALWKFPNVMITPHIAGRSQNDTARMSGVVKDNIVRFAEGKPLINVVDKKKGY
jgi:phosphoglycerate dehydrogenase-like enzyme